MAREHARILCSIWRPDSEFRHRGPDAQRLYFLLVSQREMNNAGVMPVMVSKWARCSAGTTASDVEKALAELIEHRYVVVDWDTEELLVRTYMRHDKVLNHPYTRLSALRSAEQIESTILRREVVAELVRIGHPDGVEVAARLDPDAFSTTHRDAVPMGTPTTHRDAIQPGTQTTHRDPSPSGTSTTHGGGEGGGGRGKVPVGENSRGGGNEDHPPAPPNLDPNNPRCGRHRDIRADDPGPDCRQCRDVRLRVEAQASNGRAHDDRDGQLAIRGCTWCDGAGWRIDPANRHRGPLHPGQRCDHSPLTPEHLGASV